MQRRPNSEPFSWSIAHLAIVDGLLRIVGHTELPLGRGWLGNVRQRPPSEGPVAIWFLFGQDLFSNHGPVPEGREGEKKGRSNSPKRSTQYHTHEYETIAEAS